MTLMCIRERLRAVSTVGVARSTFLSLSAWRSTIATLKVHFAASCRAVASSDNKAPARANCELARGPTTQPTPIR